MSGPFGADISDRPPRCGRCGHGGPAHRRVPGQGSIVCHDCPDRLCQPVGSTIGEDEQDEIDRLIGRVQRLLADWHRDRH
jgi:hypothetical protein